ncbi:PREDICTED: zinc finger protein Dzip1-like isoform X1 [Poecilia mexicana]|uniref:zinc finger protein Dzip1-like isoform X1 n=1 Tax=Poecilia mexicana TaxID=48701 RepID=UPI00072E835E|nr:PREDICTED: zinc finger protein Dzip1-like isoform X1 [Poecilia mexicana]XP_014862015.1 PREDICTED: zinc finger protein Dzip1-like isoform X1 [Poecilia mexicana]XP_014862016.1 PREDICTED: zinc finger protein Dzip1-like isoform X1 [Poecilia mexicana]XP_014862017.1 PREDICTED: zinc finger protein Dzip1-like isoform X1 [Poecilia mexicana]XP_014862019.1 PREDICTED: zinc finger protein Dzip1-like isoform X1 [Poecilia mexicana]XP_014862020.1 PREDICTED: zinc finger protein Dzip1-like isoform X1 [Poecil
MPFHDGVYYPYSSDAQGTHSSVGIPSLLNSPLSQHSAPGMAPAAFKFRPRRESVDWRRINAVDVDLVASQLDVDALQEHIGTVTFCSLDGERCQRCQSPVDPALVKLLRLAQLSVEWLLHCQEVLSTNLRGAEERLVAAAGEREQLLALHRKQEERAKALMGELKQRKKVIRTQQSLLAPRIMSSHKCLHCDKSFLNSSFLQNHMQRRHPDEHQSQLQSDSEKKSQIDSLKMEISSLKDQITQQQQDLQAKIAQEKEQQSMHKELLRELERFKAEEMARMDRKLEDSRDGMRREMEFLYNRNIQALTEANQNQTAKQDKPSSPVNSQAQQDAYKDMQLQAIHKLEQQMKKQDKKWESRIKEIKAQHESEKNQLLNELSRMQSSVAEHQEQSRRLQQEMDRRLQEKAQTIKAQREQMRTISTSPPTKVQEIPVAASAPVPEPKPKKFSHAQSPVCNPPFVLAPTACSPERSAEPASALKLDPIQELSEEEKDSSISEKRPLSGKHATEQPKKPKVTASAVKKNPSINKEMRSELERSLTKKLESLGVKPNQKGLTNKELASLLAKMRLKQEAVAKTMPDYWRCWEEIASMVQQKLGGPRRGSEAAPRSKQPHQVMQVRPRSSSLPSRASQAVPAATVTQPKTPQPAPRTKGFMQPKTSTPNMKPILKSSTSKTPPFSSDEDSDDSKSDLEEEPPDLRRVKSLNLMVQIKTNKPPPALSRQSAVSQSSFSSKPLQSRHRITKTQSEDDEEWSDVSDLAEIDPRQLHGFKNHNSNNEKGSHIKDKVADLARKVELHISERAVKKPIGGVSVLPERKDEVQEISLTDLEESSEWMVSSLEDKPGASKQTSLRGSGPLRKSLDSSSTSVWGTSTGKAPKSGLTETGTGSTLKSSLCSFSDISDSEDISNK